MRNSCLTDQTKNELKKQGSCFSRFSKYNPFTFLQFYLSSPPFDFLYSVWVLGLIAWDRAPSEGNRRQKKSARAKNLGERSEPSLSLGRGRVAPSTLSQSTARLASLVDFFLADKAGAFVFLQSIHSLSIPDSLHSTRI